MHTDSSLAQQIDALAHELYAPDAPGAALIAVRDGETILRRGYGMAHLELGVAIEPEMVFRIGSITKQFTAVAILMLAGQGRLALNDPITRFLPDYPVGDARITVEHLLTHTSGIRSYTDMPEWLPLWRKDFTLTELIGLFKNEPMRFAPGTRWAYNNSGYILLGAMIEAVSGVSYEGFLQQHIFDPLGMRHSCYDNTLRIVSGRVAGYEKEPDGYRNAEYLSMTQPHAAGALASSVGDLAIWDAALSSGTLLDPALLARAFAPYRLADGTPAAYGYGWALSEYAGSPLIEHGGGIHGFRSYAIRLPEQRAYVAVLSNNPSVSPEILAFKTAALLVGQPYADPQPIALDAGTAREYAGRYRSADGEAWRILYEDERLQVKRGDDVPDNVPMEALPYAADRCFLKDFPFFRLAFLRDENGAVRAVEGGPRVGMAVRAARVEKD